MTTEATKLKSNAEKKDPVTAYVEELDTLFLYDPFNKQSPSDAHKIKIAYITKGLVLAESLLNHAVPDAAGAILCLSNARKIALQTNDAALRAEIRHMALNIHSAHNIDHLDTQASNLKTIALLAATLSEKTQSAAIIAQFLTEKGDIAENYPYYRVDDKQYRGNFKLCRGNFLHTQNYFVLAKLAAEGGHIDPCLTIPVRFTNGSIDTAYEDPKIAQKLQILAEQYAKPAIPEKATGGLVGRFRRAMSAVASAIRPSNPSAIPVRARRGL